MEKQTQLGTSVITPNKNICFPIGTILAVQEQYAKLNLSLAFSPHKKKGRDINALVQALVSYKLTENFSISRASAWINRDELLAEFDLEAFEERTLFRTLETIGKNKEQIIASIQNLLFDAYDFEHTNINLDWTSLILYGEKCALGKYGYSRDHRPDKKQVTLGITELANPINIPIGLTVKPGNVNDITHFADTYNQVREKLKPGSLITFDKGGDSKTNTDLILADKMKYLTAKKLNKSDDNRIKRFDKTKTELVNPGNRIWGVKFEKPHSTDYFYLSETLEKQQIETKMRRAAQKLAEAKEIQSCIDRNKKLPKKFRINNELIDITYSYQTKLHELTEQEALALVEKAQISGREGFFCLKSTENLTLAEALETYRKKDSIEKIIHSLKNEIEIKPVRVWSEDSVYGAVLVGFIAQLIISLARYEHEEVKHKSTKFIKNSLMSLTVTVEYTRKQTKRYVYANFDPLNRAILTPKRGIT